MKRILIGTILVFSLFLGGILTYGSTLLESKKTIDSNKNINMLVTRNDYEETMEEQKEEENMEDLKKISLTKEEEEKIKDYALKYEDKMTFLDLGANIDGFKEIGKERYYQITLYSKSVQSDDLTGIVDRILISKKGNVLKGENGKPLTGIEGLIIKLNISNNERIELENIAKKYEVSLNNNDLEVNIWGEKEINNQIYYGVNLYSKSLKKEGIYEPLEKLYINKSGEVIRNTDS
ncbi:hypothetical protein [Clostridium sp. LIBA-8841]|uniref:hypothetical protein n=1 Tax=Clostridium sp. LIBA-8841 TaxID=2987530 RepID=UPI002AC3E328|nr:hypothetical protein [Clostridium sp. LIBA-8841]MDZ5253394.1 hypothetical protein [Clostridium sp. LIBA-8841]